MCPPPQSQLWRLAAKFGALLGMPCPHDGSATSVHMHVQGKAELFGKAATRCNAHANAVHVSTNRRPEARETRLSVCNHSYTCPPIQGRLINMSNSSRAWMPCAIIGTTNLNRHQHMYV